MTRENNPAATCSLLPGLLKIRDTMMDIAREHAQLQVSFERNIRREKLSGSLSSLGSNCRVKPATLLVDGGA